MLHTMKKPVCILVLGILLFSSGIYAQSILSFSPHFIIRLQDTVQEQATVTDSVTLYNNGPADYSGTVAFTTALDSLPGGPGQNVIDTSGGIFVTIPVNTSRAFGLTRTYLTANTNPPGRFKTGNNVIVVWPVFRTGTVTATDTVKGSLTIYKKRSIQKLNFGGLFDLYPNPSRDCISIVPQTGFEIGSCRICSMDGSLIRAFGDEKVLNLADLPRGIYLVELYFLDGSVGRQKLVLR
jgi:hypothetical protein